MGEERNDEYEVLESIYGENVLIIRAAERGGNVGIGGRDSDFCEGMDVVKYIHETFVVSSYLPVEYPLEAKPIVKIKLMNHPHASKFRLQDLQRTLDELLEGNRGMPVLYQAIECAREQLEREDLFAIDPSTAQRQECEEDPYQETLDLPSLCLPALSSLNIIHGETIVERKSTFQSHICSVSSMEEVLQFRQQICSDKRFARATHNIFAYRFTNPSNGVIYHDNDDDGEAAAGSRLAEMMRLMSVDGVAVIVSRWFGGTLLGPDRFKFICNSARKLLEDNGYGLGSNNNSKKGSKR